MRKFISVLTLFVFGAFTLAFGQRGPEMTFDVEVIDYGSVQKGSDGKREFHIKNTGDQPLIISACSGSCGCTVPSCPLEPIAPGAGAVISVKYDTNRVGKFEKQVTIQSNSSTLPHKVVSIKGEILQGAEQTTPATPNQ